VGLALYLLDRPTIVLQCFSWLGHLTRKNRPSSLSSMTYNVFGGTLNPSLSINHDITLLFIYICS